MTVITQARPRATHTAASLEVRAVSKNLFGRRAVHGFSLSLVAGAVHGLFGSSIVGKAAIARLLSGSLEPDAGEILFAGEVLDRLSAQRLGVVLCGERGLLLGRSVAANLYLANEPRTERGVDEPRMQREAAAVLGALGIETIDPAARVAALTTAERIVVECARACAAGTRVFVANEPWLGLDSADGSRVRGALRALAATGVSIVILSDDLVALAELCDEVSAL